MFAAGAPRETTRGASKWPVVPNVRGGAPRQERLRRGRGRGLAPTERRERLGLSAIIVPDGPALTRLVREVLPLVPEAVSQ